MFRRSYTFLQSHISVSSLNRLLGDYWHPLLPGACRLWPLCAVDEAARPGYQSDGVRGRSLCQNVFVAVESISQQFPVSAAALRSDLYLRIPELRRKFRSMPASIIVPLRVAVALLMTCLDRRS